MLMRIQEVRMCLDPAHNIFDKYLGGGHYLFDLFLVLVPLFDVLRLVDKAQLVVTCEGMFEEGLQLGCCGCVAV